MRSGLAAAGARVAVLLFVMASALGLSCRRPGARSRPSPPTVVSDASATRPSTAADPTLVGEYYEGDHLGFNLLLTLRKDASFECTSWGCGGTDGTAHGWWYRDGERVRFVNRESRGQLAGYLTSADIVADTGRPALVPPQSRDFYDKYGLTRLSALRRDEPTSRPATRAAGG